MNKKLIFDVLYDRAMIFKYINGDKNIEWFMEFKDVKKMKEIFDYILLSVATGVAICGLIILIIVIKYLLKITKEDE